MSFKNDCLFILGRPNSLDCKLFVTYNSTPLTVKEYSSLNNKICTLFPCIYRYCMYFTFYACNYKSEKTTSTSSGAALGIKNLEKRQIGVKLKCEQTITRLAFVVMKLCKLNKSPTNFIMSIQSILNKVCFLSTPLSAPPPWSYPGFLLFFSKQSQGWSGLCSLDGPDLPPADTLSSWSLLLSGWELGDPFPFTPGFSHFGGITRR